MATPRGSADGQCVHCNAGVTLDGVWYHVTTGLPPCDPSKVAPDAYRDDEADLYDIATPRYFERI